MLSAESAAGRYPVEAVTMQQLIINKVEVCKYICIICVCRNMIICLVEAVTTQRIIINKVEIRRYICIYTYIDI